VVGWGDGGYLRQAVGNATSLLSSDLLSLSRTFLVSIVLIAPALEIGVYIWISTLASTSMYCYVAGREGISFFV